MANASPAARVVRAAMMLANRAVFQASDFSESRDIVSAHVTESFQMTLKSRVIGAGPNGLAVVRRELARPGPRSERPALSR
jgi:hypothetical protein